MIEKLDRNIPYYIDYFAIFEEYQNKGYGTESIKMLINTIIKDYAVCLEIEKENLNSINTIKRANFYKKLGFRKIDSEYLLYGVKYNPYIYADYDLIKEDVDKIMFSYYILNCGKEQVHRNCKIVY